MKYKCVICNKKGVLLKDLIRVPHILDNGKIKEIPVHRKCFMEFIKGKKKYNLVKDLELKI